MEKCITLKYLYVNLNKRVRYIGNREMSAEQPSEQPMEQLTEEAGTRLPKNCKEIRYYYRHREEILAKKREKRQTDPDYQAKQLAKQKRKEEKKAQCALAAQERSKLRAEAKAKLLGIQTDSSGVE